MASGPMELDLNRTYSVGSYIDISSHTAADNPYVVPCDGYVNAIANNVNSYANIYVLNSYGHTIRFQILGSAACAVLFVRKGMQVYYAAQNNGYARFYPVNAVD